MRGHWRGWTGALALGLALAGVGALPAAAQEAEDSGEAAEATGGGTGAEAGDEEARTERARALFAEGIDLVEQQRWEEAATKFRETLELKPAPAVRYNLASALYSAGQVTEAEVLVDEVLDDPETDQTIRAHAQDLQGVMRDEAGMLRVELAGSASGSTVAIDGYELPANRVGIDVAAAPGAHVVTATRDGREVAREEATVEVGQTTSVRLEVAPAPATTAAAGLEEPTDDEPSDPSMLEDWRLWAAIGATAAVIVVTVVLLATTTGGTEDPVEGNFEPGVLRW